MRILVLLPLVALMSSVSFAATKATAPKASTGGTRTTYTYKPVQQETNMVFMPTLGTTFTQISGDQTTSFSTGFSAGMTADIGEGTTVFHTGLLYSQLNTTYDVWVTTVEKDVTATIIQNMLTVPAQAKSYFAESGSNQLYVLYGGTLNILMDAKLKAEGQSVDWKENFNTMNILATVGAGMEIPMNDNDFTVEASFSRSITGTNAKGDVSTYNTVFMVNAGLVL